ncbi:hypothetical protein AB0L53_31815 [Nonomuraea sp. NPDC052129]|uniref:hypothetical protein n=1 Tax=Nonomuraea sp. NPDC052129 TaxID=3154651 RepID=UPI003419C755
MPLMLIVFASVAIGWSGDWPVPRTILFALMITFLMGPIAWKIHTGRQQITHAAEDPGEALRHRLIQVNTAFAEAARLMDDLRRDLEAQQAAREALISQAEEQQRLLAIDQEQAEKIRQILVGETKATIRAERRQQWMFFALGVAMSIPIGVLINLLVP